MAQDIFYRPHWSELADDGTLLMRASVWDDEGHASVMVEIRPTAEDYHFWRWVTTQERFARSLDEREVAEARAEFAAVGAPEAATEATHVDRHATKAPMQVLLRGPIPPELLEPKYNLTSFRRDLTGGGLRWLSTVLAVAGTGLFIAHFGSMVAGFAPTEVHYPIHLVGRTALYVTGGASLFWTGIAILNWRGHVGNARRTPGHMNESVHE